MLKTNLVLQPQEERLEVESELPAASTESNSEQETSIESATEESLEPAEEKRGFFSRLLRRTDY